MDPRVNFARIIGDSRPAGGVQIPLFFQCRFCKQFEGDVEKIVQVMVSHTKRYFAHKTCIEQNPPITKEPYLDQEQEQK